MNRTQALVSCAAVLSLAFVFACSSARTSRSPASADFATDHGSSVVRYNGHTLQFVAGDSANGSAMGSSGNVCQGAPEVMVRVDNGAPIDLAACSFERPRAIVAGDHVVAVVLGMDNMIRYLNLNSASLKAKDFDPDNWQTAGSGRFSTVGQVYFDGTQVKISSTELDGSPRTLFTPESDRAIANVGK